MWCWRLKLRRDLTSYLNGELPAQRRAQIEGHLFDCPACRMRLESLRGVHRSLQHLPEVDPKLNAETGFTMAWPGAQTGGADAKAPSITGWRQWFAGPSLAAAMAGLVVLQFGLLVAMRHGFSLRGSSAGSNAGSMLDAGNFRSVSVGEFGQNTAPHVVTEGFAEDVKVDQQEGTLRFRLVDDTDKSSSFVVCEISDPIRLNPPPEGSRVRVYGVSRYDPQQNRSWYEINPVLKIAVLHQ
jgi:hypothetical protein